MHIIDIDWQNVDTVLLDGTARCSISRSITISGKSWYRKPTARSRVFRRRTHLGIIFASSIARTAYAKLVLSRITGAERLGLDICAMTTAQRAARRFARRYRTVSECVKAESGKRQFCSPMRIHITAGEAGALSVWPHTLIYYFPPTHLVIPKEGSAVMARCRTEETGISAENAVYR